MKMTKTTKNLLEHLKSMTDYADTYFCSIAKNNKNKFIDTVSEKIKNWVEKNGGSYELISDKKFIGDRKGYYVKIRFPSFNECKQIMSNI